MTNTTALVVAHTDQLDAAVLAAADDLLMDVFAADLTHHDWKHSLGGLHALVWDGADLIGHASLVPRRLLHAGRVLRTGYVGGVGVRSDSRRRGHGAAMMAALEEMARGTYELCALAATDQSTAFYSRRGWILWRGPTSALTPTAVVRTPEEDGCIYVLPLKAELDLHGELTCDWREGEAW
ncbi:MAG: GNAT family N-acetyltransferase [Mycobacteriaceae bacterium]